MAKKYRKFDYIFKENVVKLSYIKSCLNDLAEEVEIPASTICRWRREYIKFGTGSFPGPGYPRVHPDKKKIFEIEKETKRSELRLEILKNGFPHLFQGRLITYEFIKNNENIYSI